MSALLLMAAGVLFVAVTQSSVAPLFTFSSAAPEFGLLFLGLICLYRGSTAAMIATPALAVAEAWMRGLEPGLLLIAYIPMVPLIDASRFKGHSLFGPGLRFVAAAFLVGAWARGIEAVLMILTGASASLWDVLSLLILPGLLVDLLLAALIYAVCRTAFGEPERETWLTWA